MNRICKGKDPMSYLIHYPRGMIYWRHCGMKFYLDPFFKNKVGTGWLEKVQVHYSYNCSQNGSHLKITKTFSKCNLEKRFSYHLLQTNKKSL